MNPIRMSKSEDDALCVIPFEAPSLTLLAEQVAAWAAEHPCYRPLSLSHAQETRLVERASLAGPRHVVIYTGIMLACRAAGVHEDDMMPSNGDIFRSIVGAGR